MELINNTLYPAILFRSIVDDDHLITSVIVRVTYDIVNGKAVPSSNQEWQLYNSTWESEYGPIEGDVIYRMDGVDILVFGKAYTKNGIPAKKMEVNVNLENKIAYSLTIFGNRIWEKGFFGIAISEPVPFTEMPITLFNAYGGKAKWDGLEIPYGNNPYGQGYYWEKEDAINNPLPNVEDPDNLVHAWNHRPDPVGIASCPMNELRMRGNIEFNSKGQLKEIKPRFFNTAFPKMIASSVVPGERIIISGMNPKGDFIFEVPQHFLKIKRIIGKSINQYSLPMDQIGIIPDKNQAFITYRLPFKYKFNPMEIRKCEIFEN